MKATYSPDKEGMKLNVRKEPVPGAKVVRQISAGDYEAEVVEHGWVKFADGYADARFLTVTEGARAVAADEGKPVEEPKEAEKPASDDDERAALKKMTNPQLYDLAEQSGIHVAKGSTKAELIDAILAGADD